MYNVLDIAQSRGSVNIAMRPVYLPLIGLDEESQYVLPPLVETSIGYTSLVLPSHDPEGVNELARHLQSDIQRVLGINVDELTSISPEERIQDLANLIQRVMKSLLRERYAARQAFDSSRWAEDPIRTELPPLLAKFQL